MWQRPSTTLFPYTTLFRSVAAGTAAVLYIGVMHVQSGLITLGDLLVVMAYLAQLYGPMEALSKKVADLQGGDRKSTRLNSSHSQISDAVFCLKKKIRNRKK